MFEKVIRFSVSCRYTGSIPDVKKISIDQWLGEYCILGKIWRKQGISGQVWFVPKTAGRFGTVEAVHPQEKFNFYSYFWLETGFTTLKLAQNYYINMNIGSPSPLHILCLKDNSHNWTKNESKELQKFQFSISLWIGKNSLEILHIP